MLLLFVWFNYTVICTYNMQLLVKDYQVVQKVNILAEGFTAIKGPSSSGKSSTLKALFAALNNRFSSGVVRNGESQAVVKLKWTPSDELLTIVRSVNGGSPKMQLGDHMWSKLTRDVPSEIEAYNNLGFLQVGSSKFSLNFCTQFSKPLLLEFSQKRVVEILSSSRAMQDYYLAKDEISKKKTLNKGAFNEVESIISQAKVNCSLIRTQLQEKQKLYFQIEELYNKYSALSEDFQKVLDLSSQLNQLYKSQVRIKWVERSLYAAQLQRKLSVLQSFKDNIKTIIFANKQLGVIFQKDDVLKSLQSVSSAGISIKSALSSCEDLFKELYLATVLSTKQNVIYSLVSALNKKLELNQALLKFNLIKEIMASIDAKKLEPCEGRVSVLMNMKCSSLKIHKLQEQEVLLHELSNLIVSLHTSQSRIEVVSNILDNNLCPCCGQSIHRI